MKQYATIALMFGFGYFFNQNYGINGHSIFYGILGTAGSIYLLISMVKDDLRFKK